MRKLLVVLLVSAKAFGWGEAGHQMVAQVASEILAQHPLLVGNPPKSFIDTFYLRRFQQAHLSNIPDIHWRNLDGKEEEKRGKKIGDPTHFCDSEPLTVHELSYSATEAALKKVNPKAKMEKIGSLPWRAQQFMTLYENALKNYPRLDCGKASFDEKLVTRDMLTFAGLLSHFTADVTQPHHTSIDFDGQSTNQGGIHAYFESDLVDAQPSGFYDKVRARAQVLLNSKNDPHGPESLWKKAKAKYPNWETEGAVTALMFTVMEEVYPLVDTIRKLDKQYSFPPGKEERRSPTAVVEGKTVAAWFEPLLLEQIAFGAALTADLWVRGYLNSGSPEICWSWKYALKPSFISPEDPACAGYITPRKAPIKCRAF